MSILDIIDRAVAKYINWRMYEKVEHDDNFSDFSTIDVRERDGNYEAVISHSEYVNALLKETHHILDVAGAENYVQFDIIPAIDASFPVRITIQRAEGMSPAEKNAQLCDELERIDPDNPVLKNNRLESKGD